MTDNHHHHAISVARTNLNPAILEAANTGLKVKLEFLDVESLHKPSFRLPTMEIDRPVKWQAKD